MIVTAVNSSRLNNAVKVLVTGSVRSCGNMLIEMNQNRTSMIITHPEVTFIAVPGFVRESAVEAFMKVGWSEMDIALPPELRILFAVYDNPTVFKN